MTEQEPPYVAKSSKPAVKRAMRLVYILDLLRRRGYTIDALAAQCGVSERTIYRDIGDLQSEPIYAPLIIRVLYDGDPENCDT